MNNLATLKNLVTMMCDTPEESKMMITEYLELWLESKRIEVSPCTFNTYAMQVRGRMLPYFKINDIAIGEFSPLDAERYYAFLSTQGLSTNTIRKYHVTLLQVFGKAFRQGCVLFNPIQKVTPPKFVKFHPSFLTMDESLEMMKRYIGTSLEIPVLCALLLGLRRSEIVGLKWDNIDLQKGTITISRTVVASIDADTGKAVLLERESTKSKNSYRTLSIPEPLKKQLMYQKQRYALLKAHKPEMEPYVCFTSKGAFLRPAYITKHFKKFNKDNGLPSVRFHDLRHSCATLLLSLGYNIREVQGWLGHSDVQTTMGYLHVYAGGSERIASGITDFYKHAL